MAYFTIPYQIHYEDTMAYESHHYLTNFRFQCAVREALYFSHGLDGNDLWREDLKNLVMLTYEGYSRNLAPLRLGDRVALFLTIGESSRSSLQLCIRAVSENGTPVAAGYQRFLCIARDSRDPVPIPRSMMQYHGHINEPLTGLVFEELARKGGRSLARIFTPEIKELARAITGARDTTARFVDGSGRQIVMPPAPAYQPPVGRTALLLPGQGSYDWATLHSIYHAFPATRPVFEAADAIARTQVGHAFLPLVLAESAAAHDRLLSVFPDLDQFGIYLLGVLTARLLRDRGVQFDLIAGHSFGEIAALAASGAVSIEAGLSLVSQRILALQTVGPDCGAMAALACDEERARAYLAELPVPGAVVAVLNHPKQTVVAGPHSAIAKLTQELSATGVTATRIGGRYPFHSPLLAPAVGPFAVAIAGCIAEDTTVAPVFSPADGQVHRHGAAILSRLALDLIRPLHFHKAMQDLYAQGIRTFIQGGYGSALAKIVYRTLAGRDELTVLHCASREMPLADGLEAILRQAEATAKQPWYPSTLAQPQPQEPPPAQRPPSSPLPQSAQSTKSTQSLPIPQPAQSAQRTQDQPVPRREKDPAPALPPIEVPPHLDRTILAPLAVSGETPTTEPVAIVAMGCVLPGARDVKEFWHNALSGRSGIVDLSQLDPNARTDFQAGGGIHPDKTYSLLVGAVPPLDPAVVARLPYSPAELSALSYPETLLAVALREALSELAATPETLPPARTAYVLGATADGSMKQDLAYLLARVTDLAAAAPQATAASRADFTRTASTVLGFTGATQPPAREHDMYAAVFQRLLGAAVRGYVVDTACSSALYAIALGMRALSDRSCDVAIAGGVYEVTMGNSCLFSQFGGLSATGSRALDASADGVVFGSGAAVLFLKRLNDAIAAGDRVLGVIRGVGLSSDGKSPAVNVPQSEGQILAMERAYRAADLSPHSIQLIEAHATATPVGDATELKSLNQVYAGGKGVELRSIKSLIGHTGWVAGAASVIALCKAFGERLMPPQHGFAVVNPAIELGASPFVIATAQKPWPARQDGLPRRAAVDGFGFGGTNAHLILESYVPAFHRQLAATPAPSPKTLAIVGFSALFPAADGSPAVEPSAASGSGLRFVSERIGLPVGRRMLPDVLAAMDDSQRLALLAAQDALQPILAANPELARQTGIVLGLAGKTARGIAASERIFRDRLVRLLHEAGRQRNAEAAASGALLSFVNRELSARSQPTGPYTLSGAMPNVASGRVANFFNLKGPNLLVDAAEGSLFQALATAAQLLGGGDCDFMLAGAVNACAGPPAARSSPQHPDAATAEAVILLAVARPETAAAHGLRPIAMLELGPEPGASSLAAASPGVDYRGATGAVALAHALQAAAASGTATLLQWSLSPSQSPALLRIKGSGPADFDSTTVTQPLAAPPMMSGDPRSEPSRLLLPPQVGWYAPVLFACPPQHPGRRFALRDHRVLFVCDQPDWFAKVSEKALPGLTYRVACLSGSGLAQGLEIDTATEESIATTAKSLRAFAFDTIIAVKNLADAPVDGLLQDGWDRRFLNLLFAVTRYAYEALAAGSVALALLVLGGVKESGLLHPHGGLLAGFMKSLARELPQSTCRIVQTDQPELAAALAEAEGELAQGGGAPVETCFVRGRRHEVRLAAHAVPAAAAVPPLGADSVVVLTGGARGVTAVLAQALLERFGCRAVLLGRSAPDQIAPHLLAMSDEEFAAQEVDILTHMQATHPGLPMREARQRYQTIAAARQTQRNLSRLKSLPGAVEYHTVDVTSLTAVEEVIKSVLARLGRIDFVVHGAGVQHSKRLPRRKLAELQQTIDTKLRGLRNLYTALRRHAPAGQRVHYHLLTSAFSVLGNDGQPDYGAANEALNRLAAAMARTGGGDTWSALGWLGWDGIGMTQGTEYVHIQKERGLYAITAKEGAAIFLATIAAAAPPAVTVLLSPGERQFYQVALAAQPAPAPAPAVEGAGAGAGEVAVAAAPPADRSNGDPAGVCEWTVSLEAQPYLAGHLVRGKPTLPGTFELELAARTALRLHPELHLVGFQHCRFTRFVQLRKGRATLLRCESRLLHKVRRCTRIQLRIITDIVHPSGLVLHSGVVHLECEVLLSRTEPGPLPGRLSADAALRGTPVPDPYTDPRSPVFHGPPFDTLRQALQCPEHNRARFHPPGAAHRAQLTGCVTPFLLADAAFKAAHLTVSAAGEMPVCVIQEIGSLYFQPGLTDAALATMAGSTVLASTLPEPDDELLRVEHVEARSAQGVVLAVAGGLVARPIGRVPNSGALVSSDDPSFRSTLP